MSFSGPYFLIRVHVDKARGKAPPGGAWERLDSVAQGRVQVLAAPRNAIAQAQAAMAELQRLATLGKDWNWSACAVIAREWKYLAPVRAWCEVHGVPVELGNEHIPNFWRLRETQALCDWLRQREGGVVNLEILRQWLAQQRQTPWIEWLQQAADDIALEVGGAEVPAGHCIEWLAEWGREARRRQRGLLLVSAHRAKGLEFDHVVVLDGGWNNTNQGEDADAPRRLYYMAMTRARKTLALMRFRGDPKIAPPSPARERTGHVADERVPYRIAASPPHLAGSHPIRAALQNDFAVLRRPPAPLPPVVPELELHHQRLAMKDVDLGFAGRRADGHPLHKTIADLAPGDRLIPRNTGDRWELADEGGQVVGRLANGFRPPDGTRCQSAAVLAIVTWSRALSNPEYQRSIQCDAWEVVLPELRFVPNGA